MCLKRVGWILMLKNENMGMGSLKVWECRNLISMVE